MLDQENSYIICHDLGAVVSLIIGCRPDLMGLFDISCGWSSLSWPKATLPNVHRCSFTIAEQAIFRPEKREICKMQTSLAWFPCTLLAALSVHQRRFLSSQRPKSHFQIGRGRATYDVHHVFAHLAQGLWPVKPEVSEVVTPSFGNSWYQKKRNIKHLYPVEIKHGKPGNLRTKWRLTDGEIKYRV